MGFKSFIVIFIVAWFGGKLLSEQFSGAGETVIAWDVQEYYMYLPAAFIHHDLSFSFTDSMADEGKRHFPFHVSPASGKKIGRMSLGMSVLYLPFFAYGHLKAMFTAAPLTGFSEPYQWAIFISGFVYMLLGLWVLGVVLKRYFSGTAVALAVLCLGLGTNLYYYSTVEGGMTHAPLFFLFACFLYFTDSWHASYKWKHILGVGIIAGLAALARPTSILILIVFFLYDIHGKEDFKAKLRLFKAKYIQVLVLLAILFLMALPQLLYWKVQSGTWLYYSYHDAGFLFDKPRFYKGFFSFRKGWLIYTPMMALALAGFVFRKLFSKQWLAILVFTLINIYVVLSWWCWWYGGGFGMRALIESYAMLAFPLAAFWEKLKMRWRFWIPALVLAGFFIYLNQFQTRQYRLGLLHWESMSKRFYKETFLKMDIDPGAYQYLDPPDYEAAKQGKAE